MPSSDKPTIGFASPLTQFFGGSAADVSELQPGDTAFIGMPSDATHTSRIGTRFGPRALRHETSLIMAELRQKAGDKLFDLATGMDCVLGGDRALVDLGDAEIHPLDVGKTIRSIADMTRGVVKSGALPVAIGGDHFNSFPACLGVSEALMESEPDARFGYIQIDGHLDFCDRLAAWGPFNHATNARRCSELANIRRENMVWIGIAGWVDGNDVAEIEGFGGLIFSAEDVHRIRAREVARRAVAHAMRDCDRLYLTIDVDALDSGFLPGTGSIVHSEITCRQYLDLLEVFAEAPLCGIDMVEVSPPLDPSGRSEAIAAQLLFEILRPRLVVERRE
ncbi:MAG: agmatinase family protein [Methylobacterium sp.]|jgi:arginase family enzyme|nr:agmatinase family protein [Methylobacterium sp.]